MPELQEGVRALFLQICTQKHGFLIIILKYIIYMVFYSQNTSGGGSMSKVLTVYFSHKGENYFPDGIRYVEKGNTAYAAEHIQTFVGGDLFEIETIVPYSTSYRECVGQSVQEVKACARPKLKTYLDDITAYDTIFVCYPCWCGTAPMCVFSFLEHYDLHGKKVIPLCTNEGSGLANSIKDIKASCPGANVTAGLSFPGHKCADGAAEIGNWAKENA